jgi:hypothetical protein
VNKKKQKNFVNFWPVAVQRPREAEQKFFGSFFQKKNFLNLLTFLPFMGSWVVTQKEAKNFFGFRVGLGLYLDFT